MTVLLSGLVLITVLDVFEAGAQHVKKPRSAICHCPEGAYYDRTKNFTPYGTIKACLESGGRHPKRGQGDCEKAEPVPGSPEYLIQRFEYEDEGSSE